MVNCRICKNCLYCQYKFGNFMSKENIYLFCQFFQHNMFHHMKLYKLISIHMSNILNHIIYTIQKHYNILRNTVGNHKMYFLCKYNMIHHNYYNSDNLNSMFQDTICSIYYLVSLNQIGRMYNQKLSLYILDNFNRMDGIN